MYCYSILSARKEHLLNGKAQKKTNEKITLKTMCNICVQDRTIYILNAKLSRLEHFIKMQKVIDIKWKGKKIWMWHIP